ncbi:beta strand repeat-containing protein [Bacteroides cellulosilyticus]|uniref:beta strand repeat-containing protein n=1 Tax=Bacteroides cellulosilyticus TaxID=246787 RepID=UPI0035664459
MEKQLIARGQATILVQKDSYTIHQSVGEYIFPANNNGALSQAVTFSSVIKVTLGDDNLTNFSIGTVAKPAGFSAITVNNTNKTVTYSVASGTTAMAESGLVTIPVLIAGQTFNVTFSYAKARTGAAGVDSNMLDWVKDWNSAKTVIGSQSVITPKIFAGVKNSNNTITGIAIGKFPLSTVNASGTVATETINGIYGFKDGYKTFAIDNTGSVLMGKGNQFIRYNPANGKIEFGSEVTLNWVNAINTAKTEAINSAAATAQTKADAAKNAAITTAATDATNKVNAIRIAGRNYIRNSNFTTALTGITMDGTSISIDTATLYNNYRTLKVVQNTACTDSNAASQRTYFTAINSRVCAPASFSMYVKGTVASVMKIRIGSTGIRTVNITTAWQRIVLENITPTSAVVLFGFQTVGTYWCALPMLVEGSKAVDWSPAPEDLFTGITEAKKAGTDARTVADAITNKANTEGWATKLTYIGSTGIFTGTLSANTVNAVRINASQITAGTIDAARINVAALKTSLITAGNIEALTLNVVRGKIGGWSIDADSIFRGNKSNTSGAYTGASGSVCIGSNGIRGFKWRLDATGAGAVAGGNISWDAAGNVTFGSSVALNWTNAANTAASNGKLYVRGTGYNRVASRYISLNGTKVHESSSRGLVLSVINRSDLKVVSHTHYDVYSNDTNCNSLATAMNAIDSTKIVILSSFDAIRINATLSAAIQRCGGSDYMVTDARVPYVLIGIPGIGKNMGLTSIYGLETTAPFAEISTVIVNGIPQGINADGKLKTYLSGTGIYTGTLTAAQVNAVAINAGSITTGTLNADRIGAKALTAAKIAAGTITAAEINVASIQASVVTATAVNGLTCTFSKGTIAGWHINASQIYKNSVYLGSDGSITNSTKWKFNNDGSGQIANGNISWNAAGTVTFSSAVSLNWTDAIDKIQIGGHNLLNNSSNWRTAGWNGGYTTNGGGYTVDSSVTFKGNPTLKTDVGTGVVHSSWIKLENNVEYTYSAMVRCNKTITGNGNTPLHYWSGKDNNSQSKITVLKYDTSVVADTWKRIYVVFKLNSDGDSFRPFLYRGSNESTFYNIAYFKLEKGNKPTDWSQSDSDANKLSTDAQNSANSVITALGGSGYPKLTKISSTGIYTGTLTAAQVNAVAINASSITAGTLSADRIASGSISSTKLDAASIKANIINAGYINGLTCAFTKGTIGGWTITGSSISGGQIVLDKANKRVVVYGASSGPTSGQRVQIYHNSNTDFGLFTTDTNGTVVVHLGSNNKIAGWTINSTQIYKNSVYLGSDGSIANGTKWKFNNDGSGQIANGNISWNAAGTVTFGSFVSLNWTNAATNALNSAKSYADTKKTEAISSAATDATNKANAAKELAQAMAFGRMLYRDPEFRNGNNSVNVYNNNSNGTVTIARTGLSSAPNDSKTVLEIKATGSASPGNGGFTFSTACSNRKVFITKIIAKIPVGRNLLWASNSIGTSGSSKWLTPNAGTGDWAEYIYKVTCGTSNFSTTNFFYLDGAQGTTAAPLIWHVAYATVFDTTSSEKYTTTIDANGIYTGTVRANQMLIDNALVVGGSTYNGSISVRDAGNNVMATLDRTGITAVAGKIGGWHLASGAIYASSPAGGHRVYITSSGYLYNDDGSQDYWGLRSDGSATFGYGKILFDNDGSGYVANQNIKWDSKGNVEIKGNITANSGLIAGFTISGNKLINTAADSSIEFSSMMGNASMTINSYSSLLSLRADSARTGISIQTYATGAVGLSIVANAGSNYAIEAYGPVQFGQRAGERWCVPGVLYIGCKYNSGNSPSFSKIWGEGCNVTSSYHLGNAQYKFYHNLGHTNYTVFAQGCQNTKYYGFFRLLERASSYFVIQNVGSNGGADGSPFDFVIYGRNKWY